MNTHFADTFFFIALLGKQDQANTRATEIIAHLEHRIITTTWVLTEVADALSAPNNRNRFIELFEFLKNHPLIEIIPANQPLFEHGVSLYAARPDKHWSLTDCISFEVMRQHNLTEALTGDHHFQQAGYKALLAE